MPFLGGNAIRSRWRRTKARWLSFIEWHGSLPRDMFMTVLEAGLVLTLSQIPFFLLAIKYTMETPDTMFTIGTVIDVITNSVRPGEVLIYIAAILASATVYYIMRPRLLPNLPKTFLVCTLGPIFLLLMATPNFMADRYEKAANVEFMSDYAIFLLSTAFLL